MIKFLPFIFVGIVAIVVFKIAATLGAAYLIALIALIIIIVALKRALSK